LRRVLDLPTKRNFTNIGIIALFWVLIYGPGLFSPPLLDDADSVRAGAAQEMLTRHDYVTLHADGIRYFDKAPLLYWLTAASYSQFGFTEFGTRLPLMLLVLVLLPLLTEAFDQRYLLSIGTRIVIWAIAAVSLNMILGYERLPTAARENQSGGRP